MLAANHYGREYIDGTRVKVDRDVSAYRDLAAAGTSLRGSGRTQFDASMQAFEPVYFNNLVLALDQYFVHRTRTLEKKDGNALNEVRVLCTSLMSNDGKLAADSQIKLDPAKSVLGYRVGDEIAVCESEFVQLAKAFFAEIEAKFL